MKILLCPRNWNLRPGLLEPQNQDLQVRFHYENFISKKPALIYLPNTVSKTKVPLTIINHDHCIVEAIITLTSSDFYETSPMLRGGNRGSNTVEFISAACSQNTVTQIQ